MIEILISGVIQTIIIVIGLRLSIRDKLNYLKGFIVAIVAKNHWLKYSGITGRK